MNRYLVSSPLVASKCPHFLFTVRFQDYPCVGRILLFRLSHDVASGRLSASQLVYEREFRGPVTAIHTLEQCLLSAVGSKLLLHYWDGSKLTEAAFYDSPLLITCVNVIKVQCILRLLSASLLCMFWHDYLSLQILCRCSPAELHFTRGRAQRSEFCSIC